MSFAGRVGARITAPVCSRPEPGQLAALVSADSIASVGVWRGRSHRVQSTPEGAMSYAMGVDVSKSTLEVCAEPSATTRTFANDQFGKIGRAHVSTPVTNAHLVCRLLLETQTI